MSAKGMRIIRAIEGEGDAQKTEDFEVPAIFLKFSEALEPMSGSNDVLISEDNVVPMRDSIKSIKALVSWMIREPGFEINDENVKDLARLSDKYIIEALQKDLRNYTLKFILRKDEPTFELWQFATRYSFTELEEYCRADPAILTSINAIITDPSKGVTYLRDTCGMSPSMINTFVRDIVSMCRKEQEDMKKKLRGFVHGQVTCDGCGVKPVVGLRFKCKNCRDFDFCERCHLEKAKDHVPGHAFAQHPPSIAALLF